jgi:hypothetical protein
MSALLAMILALLPAADVALLSAARVVPRSELAYATSCGEFWHRPAYGDEPALRLVLVRESDAECPARYFAYYVAHEVGHAVCIHHWGDRSEACADAYASSEAGR